MQTTLDIPQSIIHTAVLIDTDRLWFTYVLLRPTPAQEEGWYSGGFNRILFSQISSTKHQTT